MIARRFLSIRCPANACRTICTFSSRSGFEYDFVITVMIGTDRHIDTAVDRFRIVSGNSFAAVPSTQNQITSILLCS